MLHIFPLKAYPVSVRWFCGLAETQLRTLYRQYIRNNDHFSGLVQAYLRFVSSSHVILFTVFPHDKRVVYGTHATKNTDTVPIHPCIGRMYNLYRLAKQSRPAHWLAWYSSPTCSQARAGSTGWGTGTPGARSGTAYRCGNTHRRDQCCTRSDRAACERWLWRQRAKCSRTNQQWTTSYHCRASGIHERKPG